MITVRYLLKSSADRGAVDSIWEKCSYEKRKNHPDNFIDTETSFQYNFVEKAGR